jgi:hypothetical protein
MFIQLNWWQFGPYSIDIKNKYKLFPTLGGPLSEQVSGTRLAHTGTASKARRQRMKYGWILSGTIMCITTFSIAFGGVPSRVTNDTALYQHLSEIKLPKQANPDFDSDIGRLSKVETRYNENLPSLARHPRLQAPMKRISQMKYRYSGRKAVSSKLGS